MNVVTSYWRRNELLRGTLSILRSKKQRLPPIISLRRIAWQLREHIEEDIKRCGILSATNFLDGHLAPG